MTTQCAEEKVGQHTEALPVQTRRAGFEESVCRRIAPDPGQAIPGKLECPVLPRRRFAWLAERPRRPADT